MTSEFDVVVTDRWPEAQGVVALTLAAADGQPLPAWLPGAHIDLILQPGLVRQYSLCGDPTDRKTWRVAILREPAGRGGSAHVHDMLRPGDQLTVRGPRNRFPLRSAPAYLFIAGGIGITPILPMVSEVDGAGADWRLVYGGRHRAGMAFLDGLSRYGERVTLWPQDEFGLLDLAGLLDRPRPGTLVYCCGPEPLLAAVEERCRQWPENTLHVERFRTATSDADAGDTAAAGTAFEVVLERSGRSLAVPADRSILTVVEEAGLPVLSSCREGTCGTCETGVLDGEPEHRDSVLTEAERATSDIMLICVSRSRTARLVLDL